MNNLTWFFIEALTEQFDCRISDDKNDEWCLIMKKAFYDGGWEAHVEEFIDEIVDLENIQNVALKYAIESSIDYKEIHKHFKEHLDDLAVDESEDEDSE